MFVRDCCDHCISGLKLRSEDTHQRDRNVLNVLTAFKRVDLSWIQIDPICSLNERERWRVVTERFNAEGSQEFARTGVDAIKKAANAAATTRDFMH